MGRLIFAVSTLGLAGLLGAAPASAGAGGVAAELANARANARAGGPLSDRDKELLERWGCLSGTRSAFCQAKSHQTNKRYNNRGHKRR